MVSARPGSEYLAIDHVREPGQRMPVGRVPGLERPFQAVGSHAPVDMRIARDIDLVVKIDKAKVRSGVVKNNRAQSKDKTHHECAPAIFSSHAVSLAKGSRWKAILNKRKITPSITTGNDIELRDTYRRPAVASQSEQQHQFHSGKTNRAYPDKGQFVWRRTRNLGNGLPDSSSHSAQQSCPG